MDSMIDVVQNQQQEHSRKLDSSFDFGLDHDSDLVPVPVRESNTSGVAACNSKLPSARITSKRSRIPMPILLDMDIKNEPHD